MECVIAARYIKSCEQNKYFSQNNIFENQYLENQEFENECIEYIEMQNLNFKNKH